MRIQMTKIITLITYFLDMFILFVYIEQTSKKERKDIAPLLFWGCYVLVEFVILITGFFTCNLSYNLSFYFNNAISLLSTFFICFLYKNSIKHNFFISIIFQFFVILSENFLMLLFTITHSKLLTENNLPHQPLMILCDFGSKCILLLLCLTFSFFWNIRLKNHDIHFHIATFATPLISLVLLLFIPYPSLFEQTNLNFYYLLFTCLILVNIINYFTLEKIIMNTELQNHYNQLLQQIYFQKEKYTQLSIAYRETRSIVHDVKKHYFTMQTLIKKQNYEKLNTYTNDAIDTLESTYAKVNTGNLVIDSLVTNYWNIAESKNIHFETVLHIDPNHFPINDYDLCVILGNMLDNCINACEKVTDSNQKYIYLQIIDENSKITIHTKNPYEKNDRNKSKNEQLYHGFGLENIENIAKKYHGMFYTKQLEEYLTYVILPIIDKK